MRLRLAFALAALATLAACDQAGGPKNAARAPIGAAPAAKTAATPAATPAATSPPANCPTVAPACPTPRVAHVVRRKAKVHRVAASARPAPRTYKTITTTTLPPVRSKHTYAHRQSGLPPRPYRYDELDHGEAVIILPDRPDYAEPRRHHDRSGYHRWSRKDGYDAGGRREDHAGAGWNRRHEHHAVAPPPPPPAPPLPEPPRYDRYGQSDRYDRRAHDEARYEQRRSESESQGRRYDESGARWSRHYEGEVIAPPPPPPPPRYDRYGQSSGYDRYGSTADGYERREYRSYSEQTSSRTTSSTVDGGCCQASRQAAGFDSRGYLTWPGKTPR